MRCARLLARCLWLELGVCLLRLERDYWRARALRGRDLW